MNYKIINRRSQNVQYLNQVEYNNFFSNNDRRLYDVRDADVCRRNDNAELIGYALIILAVITHGVINIIKII